MAGMKSAKRVGMKAPKVKLMHKVKGVKAVAHKTSTHGKKH